MMVHMLLVCILLTNSTVYKTVAYITILEKGVVPLESNSIGIQFYVDIVNENRYSTCGMRYWTKRCCFVDTTDDYDNFSDNNCQILSVYGAIRHTIQPKDRDTLFFVYPTLIQYDQLGICNFMVDYSCGNRRLHKRQEVGIQFDTRLKTNKNILKDVKKGKTCDTLDLDSLDRCKPVDCNLKYIGTKPYFDIRRNKCVEVAVCEADPNQDMPDIVYDPKSNTCKDLDNPLTIADIYAISSRLGVVTEPMNTSNTKVELKSNCSTISHNLQMLRDMMYGKLYPMPNDMTVDYSSNCKSAFFGITFCILIICALILSLVLCLNIFVWIHKKCSNGGFRNCLGEIKKKCRKSKFAQCESKKSKVNKEVKNSLLRDVIVTNLPIELRDSVADLCERVNREMKWKRRYRMGDIGSQVNLMEQFAYTSSRTSSTTTLLERNAYCSN